MVRTTLACFGSILILLLSACNTDSPAASAEIEIPQITPTVSPTTVAKSVVTVQRGDVVDELIVNGRVAATRNENAFFKQDGFLEVVHVQNDERVTEGQLLAELNQEALPDELSEAQARLAGLQASASHSAQQAQLEVRSAQIALEDAQGELEELRQPPTELEISAARVAVEQAQITLEDTRRDVSTTKTTAELDLEQAANAVRNSQAAYEEMYHDTSYASEEEKERALAAAQRAIEDAQANLEKARRAVDVAREAEVTRLQKAEKDLEVAQLDLEQLLAPPDPLAIAAAERAVRTAQTNLEQARLRGNDPDQNTLIRQASLDVAELQEQIEETRMYAPFDGVIAEVLLKAGDQVAAFTPVMSIVDPAEVELVVQDILVEDLAKITMDQQVQITFARNPDQTIAGVVTGLPTGATAGSDSGPELRIGFEQSNLSLDVGDLAEVLFTFGNQQDTLWLPAEAIRRFEGNPFVVVQDGDQERRVDITIGLSDGERAEILEGLQEGDRVIEP